MIPIFKWSGLLVATTDITIYISVDFDFDCKENVTRTHISATEAQRIQNSHGNYENKIETMKHSFVERFLWSFFSVSCQYKNIYTGSRTTYRVASLLFSLVKIHSKNNKQIMKLVHLKVWNKNENQTNVDIRLSHSRNICYTPNVIPAESRRS